MEILYILWGNRNTRYFHIVESNNKRKNWIHSLKQKGQTFSDETSKADIFFNHLCSLMRTSTLIDTQFNYETPFQPFNFSSALTQPITTQEIKMVIDDWPPNKTPGPDDFTGEFYKTFQYHLILDLLQVYNTIMQDPARIWHIWTIHT
jgi:hypothetical protein